LARPPPILPSVSRRTFWMIEAAMRQSDHLGRAYRRIGLSDGSWAGLVCHQFGAGRPPPSHPTVILPHHGSRVKHFFWSRVRSPIRTAIAVTIRLSRHEPHVSSRSPKLRFREDPIEIQRPPEPVELPTCFSSEAVTTTPTTSGLHAEEARQCEIR
jgi:hypothetical protein